MNRGKLNGVIGFPWHLVLNKKNALLLFCGVMSLLIMLVTLVRLPTVQAEDPSSFADKEARFRETESDNTLTVGTDPTFEPFEYYSGTEIVGYDIDLMDAVAEELGVSVDYVAVAFADLFDGLEGSDYDAAISALSIIPEREEIVDFTVPYIESTDWLALGIAVRQGNSEQRRAINEALWQLRENGVLETIRAGLDAYYDTVDVYLPDWPIVDEDAELSLGFTNSQGSTTVIQIPKGAVSESIMMTFTPTHYDTLPQSFSLVAYVFELDAYLNGNFDADFSFQTPITVQISYSDSDISGINEQSITLSYFDEETSSWKNAACGPYEREPEINRLTVPICQVGRFAFVEAGYLVHLPSVLAE